MTVDWRRSLPSPPKSPKSPTSRSPPKSPTPRSPIPHSPISPSGFRSPSAVWDRLPTAVGTPVASSPGNFVPIGGAKLRPSALDQAVEQSTYARADTARAMNEMEGNLEKLWEHDPSGRVRARGMMVSTQRATNRLSLSAKKLEDVAMAASARQAADAADLAASNSVR